MSGVSRTLVMARLAASGKAAKINPSITKTSPSAARKSDMPLAVCYRAGGWLVGDVTSVAPFAGRIGEIAEKA